jgi:hypothetical protein
MNSSNQKYSGVIASQITPPLSTIRVWVKNQNMFRAVKNTKMLFLTGLFGNSSIIAILTKLKFWKKPIYILLVTLAFSDATVLCVGLSRNWIREVLGDIIIHR